MARSKRTSRRGNLGLFRRQGIRMVRISQEPSEPSDSEPSDEPSDNRVILGLPDGLIKYASQDYIPPKKRQKISQSKAPGHANNGLQHDGGSAHESMNYIVVKESTWEKEFGSSKLSAIETPLDKTNVNISVSWDVYLKPENITLKDDIGGNLFTIQLPDDKEGHEDALLALDIHRESSKWSKDHGKIWTEFGYVLLQHDGIDHLQMVFTIKWDLTHSMHTIANPRHKIPSLQKVLERYFPDSNVTQSETWTPQDFYQSVYTPNKDDEAAATLSIHIKSYLYPFQRRAVRWLLQREGMDWTGQGVQPRDARDIRDGAFIPNFVEAKDARGRLFFVSSLFGCATLDLQPFQHTQQQLNGGILAEEMGLGKTLEIISLITLHRRPSQGPATVLDPYTFTNVQPIGTTLIICPPALVQQWISEIKRHSHLSIMHYQGTSKSHEALSAEQLRDNIVNADVVVSTYAVLSSEINYTLLNPVKSLRNKSKYERPKTPLMEFSWWRICIDEAQMVESGVSKAAIVARILPRVNAWCITGTPVRRDVNDLLGLLLFLRVEPYATTKHVWASLISTHKSEFRRLFGHLGLRHDKKTVRNELRLPAQKRYVITMPFSPIEEQHYQELFSQMCRESGLDTDGNPGSNSWDPDKAAEPMRRWLLRLRQTCVHPELGGRKRQVLGRNDGPLRTADEVLETMIEQIDIAIRTEQRSLLTSQLRRGQLFDNSPRIKKALEIWDGVAREASIIAQDYREALRNEIAKIPVKDSTDAKGTDVSYDDDSDDTGKSEEVARVSVFRNRHRAALEIEHVAVFFRANAYFQIKSNVDMTTPGSPEFQELEKLESGGYEHAKKLRREILREIFGKADKLMRIVSKRASTQAFAQIPKFNVDSSQGGPESRRIGEQLELLALSLNTQANILEEWREKTIRFLLRPLVDEDEEIEVTGEEYEESTKNQDEIFCYVQALRIVISDRYDTLTGRDNELAHYEVKTALRLAKEGKGAFPTKTLDLLHTRGEIKSPKEKGSVRGIIAELRSLATSLRPDADSNSRAHAERSIIEMQLSHTQKQLSEHTKVTVALEREIELFTKVMNYRLEYYRQLQEVSDSVAPYEGPVNDGVYQTILEAEEKMSQSIATTRAKRRYLQHLQQEASNPDEQRICVICRENFEVGAITVCGHQYCRTCITEWWHSHRTCPVCKRKINLTDLHEITYKPQVLSIEAEEVQDAHQERACPSSTSRKSAIYSEISKTKLAEITNIELSGPSFTTKINTLARHLLWLRESDPGAKSIIYSQFKDFLEVLSHAFKKYRIGFSSIDKPNGIESFKTDPAVECFLLHTRAHSSGLNLVNASHVFLCEPLLNTALELQAIARVDRIGQQQETNVWLYLIADTVEESIHQLSVKRRMEHIGQATAKGNGKAKETTPEEILDSNLEEANSLELQQAPLKHLMAKGEKGAEVVEKEDLWDCLFGAVGKRKAKDGQNGDGEEAINHHELRHELEVRRHIGAEEIGPVND